MEFRADILLAAALAGIVNGAAFAQSEYPGRPVRIIVAFPPGGATDLVARLVAASMERRFKQSFFIDNRPGGQTAVGLDALVRSPPDGYTISVTGSIVISQVVNKDFWQYRFDRDVTVIAYIAGGGYAITVANSVPVSSLRELIAYTRANPGRLNHAEAAGINTDMAILKYRVGMGPMEAIIYKGGPLAVQAIVSGESHLYAAAVLDVLQFARDGKLRIIAYTARERHPLLPAVPTVNESNVGVSDFEGGFPLYLMGPAKLPGNITDLLNKAILDVQKSPEFLERTGTMGLRTIAMSPEEAFNSLAVKLKALEQADAAGVKLR